MAIVCDAIRGGHGRLALLVIEAFHGLVRAGHGDIEPEGDTTLSDYGGYKAEGGKLVFNKVIKAQAPS